jgi:hypothetical protein
MDMHGTVTRLRAELATPDGFRAWLGRRKASDLCSAPLADYISAVLTADRSRGEQSDSTHAYWWIDGQPYSLMLPEWARALHRGVAGKPPNIISVLEVLDTIVVTA